MIVIATKPQPVRCAVTAEHREQFLMMLPQIQRQAQVACRGLGAEARQEFTQAVVANAYAAFARLVQRGRVNTAFATTLAQFGIRQVRCGRSVGSPLNSQDVCSRYAQIARRFQVDRLDRRYADGQWREILVESRVAGPAEVAAARLDFATWLASLSVRKRRIAEDLAYGHRTEDAAQKHGVSSARISQLRQELRTSWLVFQDELPEVLARRTRSAPARRGTPALCAG